MCGFYLQLNMHSSTTFYANLILYVVTQWQSIDDSVSTDKQYVQWIKNWPLEILRPKVLHQCIVVTDTHCLCIDFVHESLVCRFGSFKIACDYANADETLSAWVKYKHPVEQ